MRKQTESELASMFRRVGAYAHKWRDRGYVSCPSCGKVLLTCPHCKNNMLFPKAETKPDYLIALKYVYVEVKSAKERFAFSDISPTQRMVLEEHESWLFIVVGAGRAPSGRHAYLIPWKAYKDKETELSAKGVLSLGFVKARNPGMSDVFEQYMLIWKANEGWTIPITHDFMRQHLTTWKAEE